MFSDLMRFYETKQYKKGMKAAGKGIYTKSQNKSPRARVRRGVDEGVWMKGCGGDGGCAWRSRGGCGGVLVGMWVEMLWVGIGMDLEG